MNKEFKELFSNLSEKDQKEVANLIRFKNEVKYHDKQFEELLQQYIELSREYDKSQNNWNELKKWLEEEHNKNISWYGSLTHHDKQYYLYKFGTTKDVLDNVQDKMQELENGNNGL